jgi:rhamnopyranosyl-N-acetylglucosaminyl-diphospho-decaprenol beta-1,3/1,4-galactofuranosyltransferase
VSPPNGQAERVCAVVVTYNRVELLRECLTALERQSRPLDLVMVIDNASSDGTPEVVRSEHPSVELVQLPDNRGGAGGFEEGVRRGYEAGYDWLWLMDDDTIPTETALEELLAAPAALGDVARPLVLASMALLPDRSAVHPFNFARVDERFPLRTAQAVERGYVPIRYTSFVAAFIHRDAVAEYGLPIGEYFIWLDDVEYTSRVIRERPGFLAPRSIVIHKSHTRGSSEGGERYYYAVRNMIWLLRSGSLRGERGVRARLWLTLFEGIPAYLKFEHFRPRAFRTVIRGLRDGLGRLPA